ncbi:MAG: hypothetical protein RIT45_1094 [Pseudomonadota bacterium]
MAGLLVGAILGLYGCSGAAEPAPFTIASCDALRLGSALGGEGAMPPGQRLVLYGEGGELTVDAGPAAGPSGTAGGWSGVVVGANGTLADGTALTRACALADVSAGVATERCIVLRRCRTRSLAALAAPTLVDAEAASGGWALGREVEVVGAGLPVGAEGVTWLQWEASADSPVPMPTSPTSVVDVATETKATTRLPRLGSWQAGVRHVRARFWRRLAGSQQDEAGPWGPIWTLRTLEPSLSVADGALRVGEHAPATLSGIPAASGLLLQLDGVWLAGSEVRADWRGAARQTLPLALAEGAAAAWLPAATASTAAWSALQPGDRFEGSAALVSADAALPARPCSWRFGGRRQHVVVAFDPSAAIGLWRFGLAVAESRLRARVLALVAEHFAPYAVQVHASWPTHVVEAVRVEVHGDDPNGMGLLGTEPSPGKDDGNLQLDEAIGGFCPDAWEAGVPAWGGVFLSGFLRFSPTLLPSGGSVDARFDALFGPFAPELGGIPALKDGPALDAAVEALAQLVAGTVSHETGHALGLAAGTTGWHHPGDSPGWRMDGVGARPFAERAGLAGAIEERWGVVDDAYLQEVLPKSGVAP